MGFFVSNLTREKKRQAACLVSALVAVSLLSLTSTAQVHKVLAPHKPVPPRVDQGNDRLPAPVARTMMGGFWKIGPTITSTIRLKNDVQISSIRVTPVLYLSNGQEFF